MSKSVGAVFWSALVVLGCGEQRPDAPPPLEQKSASQPQPEPPMSPESEMTLLIRALWPIAREVDTADSNWATCHDHTKGFDDTRACLTKALGEAKAAQARMPQTNAKTHCGKSVADAHRDFVKNRVDYLQRYAEWMEKNAAPLRGRMAAKPLQDAASGMNWPVAADSGLATITGNPCVVRLFNCPGLGCSSMFLNKEAGLPDR